MSKQQGQSFRKRPGDKFLFVLEFLVKNNADPSLEDMYGCTALDYAARAGVLSHVEYLCSLGSITRAQKEHALFSTVASTGPLAGSINVVKYLFMHAGVTGLGPDFSGNQSVGGTLHPVLRETILHVSA